MGAEVGDLSRFDIPRELMTFLSLIPSAYASGARRQQGSLTKAGNTHARRALVEGAWAYCDPATLSRQLPRRLKQHPTSIQEISWNAQVRRCQRDRKLTARGKHATLVMVAIARARMAFMWAMTQAVPRPASPSQGARAFMKGHTKMPRSIRRGAAPVGCHPRSREAAAPNPRAETEVGTRRTSVRGDPTPG